MIRPSRSPKGPVPSACRRQIVDVLANGVLEGRKLNFWSCTVSWRISKTFCFSCRQSRLLVSPLGLTQSVRAGSPLSCIFVCACASELCRLSSFLNICLRCQTKAADTAGSDCWRNCRQRLAHVSMVLCILYVCSMAGVTAAD